MLVTYIFYLIFVHLRSIQGLLYGYVANGESIIRIKLNHSSNDFPVETIHSSDGYIQSIALDEKNNILIWADLKKGEIKKSTLTGRNVKTIISRGIGKVTGVDIEWSSGNLYWVDADRKYIEVATTAGEYRKTLIKLEEDDIPTSIVADGILGNLFWSIVGPNPRVEMSTLSGENQTTLISSQHLLSPIEMVLEYSTNLLIILDNHENTVVYINLTSGNADFIYNTTSLHGHNLFGFYHHRHQSYLEAIKFYFTDYVENALYYYDGSSSQKIYRNQINNFAIGKIKVTRNEISLNVKNVCSPGMHNCSHLCLKISANESACYCPDGMMKSNSSGCNQQIKDATVYFTEENGIVLKKFNHFKNQIGFTLDTVSECLLNPVAVRYRQKDNSIYAINKHYQLASMKIDGSNLKFLTSYIFAKVFAVHEYNDVIFYYNTWNLKIMMSSFDGKYKRIVISSDTVVDMSLYEEMGYIYYINHAGACIYRVNIDGLGRTGITTYNATVLTVDKEDNKIYWFQRSDISIYKSDLNLQNRHVIFQKTQIRSTGFSFIKNFSLISQPSNIFSYKDHLYISDIYHNTILMANKYFGKMEVLMTGLNQPANIFVREETPRKGATKKYNIYSTESRCYKTQQECANVNISANQTSTCPSGFYSSRVSEYLCLNCSEGLGERYVCPCKDWASCAIRAIPSANGCPPNQPYMAFRIRECIEEHRPGHCPYQSEVTCSANSSLCDSDSDCGDNMKCCKQECGSRCLPASQYFENPCSIGNGGCSDICVATKYSYHCLCPDGVQLQTDRKTCRDPLVDPCSKAGCANACKVLHGVPVCLCPEDSLLKSIGKTCEVTPCLGYGCSDNCTVINGQPKCECKSGDILKKDKKTCMVDPCRSYCSHNCTIESDRAKCHCPHGYIFAYNSRRKCIVHPCSDNECSYNCALDSWKNPYCKCPNSSYHLMKDKKTCIVNPCINYGCSHLCRIVADEAKCYCPQWHILRRDKKTCYANPCNSNGGCDYRCKIVNETAVCQCQDGYILKKDQKSCIKKECDVLGCSHDCLSTSKQCKCPSNMILTGDNKTCIVNPCKLKNCDHSCSIIHEEAVCSCFTGYGLGQDLKSCIDERCFSNACLNRGICVPLSLNYYCRCNGNWIGKFCDINIEEEKFMHVSFKKTNSFKKISPKRFKEELADIHKGYCRFISCDYENTPLRPVSIIDDFQFGEEDIHVTQQEETDNEIKFSYVVLKPKNNHVRESFLTQSTMKNVLKTFGKHFYTEYGLSMDEIIPTPKPPFYPIPEEKDDMDITKKIGIAIGVLLVVTFMVILICFCRIKPGKSKQGREGLSKKDGPKIAGDNQSKYPEVEVNEPNPVLDQQIKKRKRRRTTIKRLSVKSRGRSKNNNNGMELQKKKRTTPLPYL